MQKLTDIKNTKLHNPSEIMLKDSKETVLNIKLYGIASIKAKCREYLNGHVTKELENGDFEFCFSVPEHEAFWYGVLLSFGDKATVIEPIELKQRILQTCRELEHLYNE